MKISPTLAAMFTASFLAAPAALAGEDGSGPELGLRLGYGIPMGDVTKDVKGQKDAAASDLFSGMVPIWVDAGYRIDPGLYVGLYAQYAPIFIRDADQPGELGCQASVDCSGSDLRLGVNAHYHFSPEGALDPWVGLGVGYEIARVTAKKGGIEGTLTFQGIELFNLQVGADYKATPALGVGPFLSFSLGKYSSVNGEGGTSGQDFDVDNSAMHQWLVLGVRGSFVL